MKLLESRYVLQMLDGMLLTLQLFAVTWVLAFIIAVLLTVARASGWPALRWLVDAFVEFQRNVPMLVHVLFWYFGVPTLLPEAASAWLNEHDSNILLAGIALSLSSAAYSAEDMRGGLRAIPHTQFEAARAMGASYLQCMRFVVVPQALRHALPALVGRALLLFKGTSVAMAIGVAELTFHTREVDNETYQTFATYAVATALYLAGSFAIMTLGARIAARYRLQGKNGA